MQISKKQNAASALECGRSMIEMLGVLAIIGVLSVGGIAGYSKAMTKFKINKTVSQVSQIAANVRTLYSSQGSYSGLNGYIVQKAKLAPDEVFTSGKYSGVMINAFGGGLSVGPLYSGTMFEIEIASLPEDACMELATLDWGAATSSGLYSMGLNSGSYIYASNMPMQVSVAASKCNGNYNWIDLIFQ
jgi:type II secretory pathway pseudopilin PulG